MVKVARKLVTEDELRIFCQSACNSHSLLLTAGKLTGVSIFASHKSHHFKQGINLGEVLIADDAHSHLNVLSNCQFLKKIIMLKNKADISGAIVLKIGFLKLGKGVCIRDNVTAGDGIKTAKQVKQGGFTASAFTDYENQSRIGKLKVYAVKSHTSSALSAIIHLSNILEFNHIILLTKICIFRSFFGEIR